MSTGERLSPIVPGLQDCLRPVNRWPLRGGGGRPPRGWAAAVSACLVATATLVIPLALRNGYYNQCRLAALCGARRRHRRTKIKLVGSGRSTLPYDMIRRAASSRERALSANLALGYEAAGGPRDPAAQCWARARHLFSSLFSYLWEEQRGHRGGKTIECRAEPTISACHCYENIWKA